MKLLKAQLTFREVHISDVQRLRLSSTTFLKGLVSGHAEGEPVDMGILHIFIFHLRDLDC